VQSGQSDAIESLMITLLQLGGRFEKLLARLPRTIRTPVESEWRPLKELFIDKRAPRLVVAGAEPEAFLRALFLVDASVLGEAGDDGWRSFQRQGKLEFAVAEESAAGAKSAIAKAAPDLFLFAGDDPARPTGLTLLRELHQLDEQRYKQSAPIIATCADPVALLTTFENDDTLGPDVAAVIPSNGREAILAAIARALPQEARLEFARFSADKTVQREIATTLTRSATAVCAAIGTQPIPLADFPILTSVQVLMTAGIIHVAGRDWNLATARAFLAALGMNVGAGLVFRESARAALKLLPGWGNAISGAIAGAGTYAVGRAANSYFIEGLPIKEVRRLFRRAKRDKLPKPAEQPKLR
jgi:uncharacterized protein (DUF697 family)